MPVPLVGPNGEPIEAVHVANTITATISGTVTVTGTVTIGSQPISVQISGTPSVSISGTPDVKLAGDSTSLLSGQRTISTTATKIPSTTLSGRRSLLIRNTEASGGKSIFIGPSSVTTTTGFELLPGAAMVLPANLDVYGIVGTGSARLDYVEIS